MERLGVFVNSSLVREGGGPHMAEVTLPGCSNHSTFRAPLAARRHQRGFKNCPHMRQVKVLTTLAAVSFSDASTNRISKGGTDLRCGASGGSGGAL